MDGVLRQGGIPGDVVSQVSCHIRQVWTRHDSVHPPLPLPAHLGPTTIGLLRRAVAHGSCLIVSPVSSVCLQSALCLCCTLSVFVAQVVQSVEKHIG